MDEATKGRAAFLEDFRIAFFDLPLGVRVYRAVSQGRAVVRRALKDGQLADLLGDLGDELDCGRPGADDRHPLAAEVPAFFGPLGGMEALALEAVASDKIRDVRRRQDSDGGDEKARPCPLAIVGLDLPAGGSLIIRGSGDTGAELDVAAQVEFIRYVVEIALGLRLGGEVLAPVPLLQEFFGE